MLSAAIATDEDAAAIAQLRTAVADDLTRQYGCGHWSAPATEAGVLRGIKASRVLVARSGSDIVATLRLVTRRPWAINPRYFTRVRQPLYLVDMAVEPRQQRRGIGRYLLGHAMDVAGAWPSDAIRLDAYDAAAGAGPFYAKCGFREVGRVSYRGVPLVYFERVLRRGG